MTTTRPPLFIVCPGRSFSSVVCAVIGQHPDAFSLPEVNLFKWKTVGDLMDYASPMIGLRFLASGLRRTLAQLVHGEQTDEAIAAVDVWLDERRNWTGGQMFAEICRLSRPKFVVEKSPSNTHRGGLRRIIEDFPDARFLHLSRHPRATCRSREAALAERPLGQLNDSDGSINDSERAWLNMHERIVHLGATLRPDQYLFLQGEWFIEDPDNVLRQVCEWLDIPVNEQILGEMKQPENSPFSGMGPESAPTGNNPEFLKNPKLRSGKIKEERLDGPLEWTSDEAYFCAETIMLAHMMGYRQ